MTDRKYGNEAAGAGDLGNVITDDAILLGPCPSCGATISVSELVDPRTGRAAHGMSHPMPFCHYFGATTPEQIEVDIKANTEVH